MAHDDASQTGRAPSFASFWAGSRVSAFEAACLHSFVRRGHRLTVYSYEPIGNLPDGVLGGDARSIVDERFMSLYLIKGAPSLSHFSDVFRYKLFGATGDIWVDSDMLLLRPLDVPLPATLLAREDAANLCGAIMRLDRADPALPRLLAAVEGMAGRELQWGETGPRLLTATFGRDRAFSAAFGPELFFPIHYDAFWKVFLPEHRSECEAACAGSYTVHLWNNIVAKLGVWKEMLPPEGSFLEGRFRTDGSAAWFRDTYPAPVMRQMIENYRMRMSGNFQDVRRLAEMVVPGLGRRARRGLDRVWRGLAAGR